MTRTNALEALVISGWVRGLSDRDIEAALAEVLGSQAALSRSTVSRICSAIKDEFAAWCVRRLDDIVLDYLFLDTSNFRMHPNAPAEPGVGPPGESPPTASRSSSAWPRRARSPPTRGPTSSASSPIGGYARRCWASLTAPRA